LNQSFVGAQEAPPKSKIKSTGDAKDSAS